MMPYADPRRKKASDAAYRLKNIESINSYQVEYRLKNKERKKSYDAAYYLKNAEERKTRAAEYRRLKNPEEWKAYNAAYYQENKGQLVAKQRRRRASELAVRIGENLRSRLRAAIKRNSRAGSAVRDLGCTIAVFKEYIAAQFQPGMTWENYGKWQLDHIRPLCSFDLTARQQFLQACHFSNMQPLWAEENLRKGGKYHDVATGNKNPQSTNQASGRAGRRLRNIPASNTGRAGYDMQFPVVVSLSCRDQMGSGREAAETSAAPPSVLARTRDGRLGSGGR